MKNKVKIVGAIAVALMLNACAGGTYKIKSENGKTMNQVPKWYMADFSERKACDTDLIGKGKEVMSIWRSDSRFTRPSTSNRESKNAG